MSMSVRWARSRSACRIWIAALAVLLGCAATVTGTAQDTDARDYTRITQVPRAEIDAWLKQEVSASGGDWNRDRFHIYMGFSTGHFGQDPVHGIAMRRLAFSLVNNSLAAGDKITPFAWELTTWDVGPTVALTEEPTSRAEFVNRVPYAPRSDSHGGHDVERALYETVTRVIPPDETGSAIVLLLTNSNASQAPTGEKAELFGADNPLLVSALRKGGFRLPLVRKEFRLRAGAQPVTVAITALFPQKLVSLPGAPTGPRYPTFARESWQPSTDRPAANEPLPNPVAVAPPAPLPPRPAPRTWFWPLVVLLGVAVIVAGAAAILRSQKPHPSKTQDARKESGAGPRSAPLPGSLTVTIGPAAESFDSLTTASLWTLTRDVNGTAALVAAPLTAAPVNAVEKTPAAPATPLAALSFDARRVLRVEANSGAQFIELQGTAAGQSDSRLLLLEPGKRVLCRVLPPDSATKIRFEILYELQKGSRV